MSDLFSVAVARTTDPETSHEAAASVKNLCGARKLILSIMKDNTAALLHDEQIFRMLTEAGFKISASGARTRRSELVKMGLVKDSGMRIKLATGRQSILWQVV